MSNTLFIILLSIISIAFAQFSNCAKLGLHTLEWKVTPDNKRVEFQAKVSKGQKGWVAFAVATETSSNVGMNNMTLVMGFKNGTKFNTNEYWFNSPNRGGRPVLYSPEETQMTAATLSDNGDEGLTLTFSRPLTANNVPYYFPIETGKKVRVVIAYNLADLPTSPSNWAKHNKIDGKDVDLFAPYGIAECNSASTPKLVLFSIFAILLTYFL
jgi:hypothetical protein